MTLQGLYAFKYSGFRPRLGTRKKQRHQALRRFQLKGFDHPSSER